jgi:hypothetical protein
MSATAKTTVKFSVAVNRARTAAKSFDGANWKIGDLALTVDTSEYGAGTVQRFADEIPMPYKTVMDLRKVASRYATDERSDTNKWTVHQILSGQDDRAELVKKSMSAADARALVTARKDAANGNAGDGDNTDDSDNAGNGNTDPRAKLVSEVARLTAELDKATAALALYDAENPVTPAGAPVHSVAGVPSHTADQPRTDCPVCDVKPMPAPRKSRTRKPAGAAK